LLHAQITVSDRAGSLRLPAQTRIAFPLRISRL
jgi:hypothetical protein